MIAWMHQPLRGKRRRESELNPKKRCNSNKNRSYNHSILFQTLNFREVEEGVREGEMTRLHHHHHHHHTQRYHLNWNSGSYMYADISFQFVRFKHLFEMLQLAGKSTTHTHVTISASAFCKQKHLTDLIILSDLISFCYLSLTDSDSSDAREHMNHVSRVRDDRREEKSRSEIPF